MRPNWQKSFPLFPKRTCILKGLGSVLQMIVPAIGPPIGGRHTASKIVVVEPIDGASALPIAKAPNDLTALQLFQRFDAASPRDPLPIRSGG